jgi:hypothetical protein
MTLEDMAETRCTPIQKTEKPKGDFLFEFLVVGTQSNKSSHDNVDFGKHPIELDPENLYSKVKTDK